MEPEAGAGETAGEEGAGAAGLPKTSTASKATMSSQQAAPSKSSVKKKGKLEGLKSNCRACCNYLYDKEEKTVMGRSGRRWALLCVFYILFYLSIAALFMGLLGVVFYSLDTDLPTEHWQPEKDRKYWDGSRLQKSPSIIFVPQTDRIKNPDTPLVWIKQENAKYWGDQVHNVITGYQNAECQGDKCFKAEWTVGGNSSCDGTLANQYGFATGKPTFIVRLTRMLKWKPELFATEQELIDYMNNELQDSYLAGQREFIQKQYNAGGKDRVFVVCEGETAWDNGMLGEVTYCTGIGLESKYFPFESAGKDTKKKYLPPFVAIQFKRAIPGVPITVECYALAKNIKPNSRKSQGTEIFEFMIDV